MSCLAELDVAKFTIVSKFECTLLVHDACKRRKKNRVQTYQ